MWRDIPACGHVCRFLNSYVNQSIDIPVPFTPVAFKWSFMLAIRSSGSATDAWTDVSGFLTAQPLRARMYMALLLSIPRTTLVYAYLRDYKDAFPLLRQELDVERWRVFVPNPLAEQAVSKGRLPDSGPDTRQNPTEVLAPLSVSDAALLWSLIPGVHITYAAAQHWETSPIYATIVMSIGLVRTVVEFALWVRLVLFLLRGQLTKAGGTLVMGYGVPLMMTVQALVMMNVSVWFIPSSLLHLMCSCFILFQPLFNTAMQCSSWLCNMEEMVQNPGEAAPAVAPTATATAVATAKPPDDSGGAVHWPPGLNIPAALDELMAAMDGGQDGGGCGGDLEVPLAFICPITHSIMRQPAVTGTGASYEQEAIEKWLVQSRTDPLTQIKLTSTMLFPNLGLRSAIEGWLTKHHERISSIEMNTEPAPGRSLQHRSTSKPDHTLPGLPYSSFIASKTMVLTAADENACTWLRLAFHSITCHSSPDRQCLLGDRCKENKNLLTHIIVSCSGSSSCPYPGCAAVRSLLRHYNACKANCEVCCTVATEMNGGWHAKMQGEEDARSYDCSVSGSICTESGSACSSSHAVAGAGTRAAVCPKGKGPGQPSRLGEGIDVRASLRARTPHTSVIPTLRFPLPPHHHPVHPAAEAEEVRRPRYDSEERCESPDHSSHARSRLLSAHHHHHLHAAHAHADGCTTSCEAHAHTALGHREGGAGLGGELPPPLRGSGGSSLRQHEQEQVLRATQWMVHALMAPATTDGFGHDMWAHVLGCCEGGGPCASGANCRNVKSTMRHLLQCAVSHGRPRVRRRSHLAPYSVAEACIARFVWAVCDLRAHRPRDPKHNPSPQLCPPTPLPTPLLTHLLRPYRSHTARPSPLPLTPRGACAPLSSVSHAFVAPPGSGGPVAGPPPSCCLKLDGAGCERGRGRHDPTCPLCVSICDFFSGTGKRQQQQQGGSATPSPARKAVVRPHDIETLIMRGQQTPHVWVSFKNPADTPSDQLHGQGGHGATPHPAVVPQAAAVSRTSSDCDTSAALDSEDSARTEPAAGLRLAASGFFTVTARTAWPGELRFSRQRPRQQLPLTARAACC
ncbi:MAG: hypothetical protein WDW38_008224 [Sanguina aurantia]